MFKSGLNYFFIVSRLAKMDMSSQCVVSSLVFAYL